MADKSVKVLRSIGTVAGVLHAGDVVDVDEGTADSWVEVGFAEYADKAAPKKVETPEDKLVMEVAVDGPDETKEEPKKTTRSRAKK